ncbi:hypothetical protein MKW94_019756, partial [Papaver nudicaule]|nr:hypothetical protein [Papaver nudicaule]
MALSILRRVPALLTNNGGSSLDLIILKLLVLRPFVFRSGHDLVWWERWIYSIIEVDSQGYDYDIKEEKGTENDEEINPSEQVENDEENPPGISTGSLASKGFPTCKGTIITFIKNILVYSIRYLMML